MLYLNVHVDVAVLVAIPNPGDVRGLMTRKYFFVLVCAMFVVLFGLIDTLM